jgi:hypothetical protein
MDMDSLKNFKKNLVESMKVPPARIAELANDNKAPIEPAIDEYHIQLSIAEANPTNQSLDTIKAVINGTEVLIKIPDIK